MKGERSSLFFFPSRCFTGSLSRSRSEMITTFDDYSPESLGLCDFRRGHSHLGRLFLLLALHRILGFLLIKLPGATSEVPHLCETHAATQVL